MSGIKWDDVDFASKSDAAIASELGVTRNAVYLQRKKRGIEKKKDAINWKALDWRFSDQFLANETGRSKTEVKRNRPEGF